MLHLPPLLFAGTRFIAAGLIMLLIARLLGARVQPTGREWRDLAVLALLAFVISNGLSIWALQWLPSNQAALLRVGAAVDRAARRLRYARPPAGPARTGRTAAWFSGHGAGDPALGRSESGRRPRATGRRAARLPVLGGRDPLSAQRRAPHGGADADRLADAAGRLRAVAGRPGPRGEATAWHLSWTGALALAYLVVFASCLAHTAYAWLALRTSPTSLGTYAYVNPLIATLLGWWDRRSG